ncbi:MAG: PRC-barrel domain-containing protein [Leptolyngbya sp. Prado105]|jgi:sporulation protein YlmC with PRC-barrel domain|nr:PRC-barrel domain-containing protein [Leptolyngbya sp. Prado105]
MALYKVDDFYSDYKDSFSGHDIKNFDVYADRDDKVGNVKNVLVDEDTGRFRYFIVDTGFWFLGKQVLLPVGLAQVNYEDKQVVVPGLTKQQVENLPEFTEDLRIDNDYEEQVRNIYSPLAPTTGIVGTGYPLLGPGIYDRYPTYYGASGSFRDYEDQLIARRREHSRNIR